MWKIMFTKPRSESLELKIFRILNSRMILSAKDANCYLNLEKGFQGEQQFDEWLKKHADHFLILNDLWLESNNTLFQIDSFAIAEETIYIFEVKNFQGDYYIEGDKWYSASKEEISNPLLQLKKSESLLRQLLKNFGFHFPIQSYLIFINPEFYLYQAPLNQSIIFPTQLYRFMKKLNTTPAKLNNRHSKLGKYLSSTLLKEAPPSRRL